jgi:hypothetical protein
LEKENKNLEKENKKLENEIIINAEEFITKAGIILDDEDQYNKKIGK